MDNKCPNCGVSISDHEAGRCMDAWVHQFKYPRLKVTWQSRGKPVPNVHDIYIDGEWGEEAVPKYSEDMNHARELWSNNWSLYKPFNNVWAIRPKTTSSEHVNIAEAPTDALALARAFLLEDK